jgi:protein transport protein SEC20
MQGELSRSRFAQETLEQSTAALADLGERYTDLNSLLKNSRNLVTTLLKSTKSDTWYLETAFYILVTTITWLIFRRWLYGPISWFIWWPLKLVYRFTFFVFGLVGASAKSSAAVSQSQEPTTRAPLKVKPSASSGPPKRVLNSNEELPYVRVGLGGQGHNDDPNAPRHTQSLSEEVGEMMERSQQQQEEQKEPVRRGDGTILEERGDRPKNPKKKMWEENVEIQKDEEAQANVQDGSEKKPAPRKRDEL